MRVISGKNRGTKLQAPSGITTRPTTDRIKETLFNMMSFDLPQCRFLDLFSGSGAIGIEALSRGSEITVFVEMNQEALKCIEENLTKTKLKDKAIVYGMDIYKAIDMLDQKNQVFDIIFLDPPYHAVDIQKVMTSLSQSSLLHKDGYIVLEQSTEKKIDEIEGLVCKKEKHYKTTTLSFFERI